MRDKEKIIARLRQELLAREAELEAEGHQYLMVPARDMGSIVKFLKKFDLNLTDHEALEDLWAFFVDVFDNPKRDLPRDRKPVSSKLLPQHIQVAEAQMRVNHLADGVTSAQIQRGVAARAMIRTCIAWGIEPAKLESLVELIK